MPTLAERIETLPSEIAPPEECPACMHRLTLEGSFPFCPNWNCPERMIGRVQKFVNELDLKDVGEEAVRGLVSQGSIRTAADLFDVTEEQFCKIERKGSKHYAKFKKGLEKAKSLHPPQVFSCLDIDGTTTWENICRVEGLTSPRQVMASAERGDITLFAKAERVSEERAQKIVDALLFSKDTIWALIAQLDEVKEAGTQLKGLVFCITGSLSKPRSDIAEEIKSSGGVVASGITSKVTHLVCNDPNPTSGKGKKARDKGVPIISEEALSEMISGASIE